MDDTEPRPDDIPANDNRRPGEDRANAARQRLDTVALSLARLIGRQIAREEYERLSVANDNRPVPDVRRRNTVDNGKMDLETEWDRRD